jgi:hypothetical protein
MTPARKAVAIWIVAPCFIITVLFAFLYFSTRTKLQTLESPDGKHIAELHRSDFIDRNYTIFIDGKQVYSSPDFAPRRNIPFREVIGWDATGMNLIFEVGGKRVAGISLISRMQLSDAELLALEPTVYPPLTAYGFEAEWPGIGRATDAESRTDNVAN